MREIKDKQEFQEFSVNFQKNNKMPFAYGIGINYRDSEGANIATKWLTINVNENMGAASAIMEVLGIDLNNKGLVQSSITNSHINDLLSGYFLPFSYDVSKHANIEALEIARGQLRNSGTVIMYADENVLLNEKISTISDAHFRLALMSRLYYKPNTLNLENIFSILPNLVWNAGNPMTIEDWNQNWYFQNASECKVDKIPLLTWGVPIPKGVRMPNPFSARLGAYLSPGTTIMPYGFVNYNAGTLGKSMIEGTIAAGTTIDDGTNIGKGGGFLGTLSGGNTVKLKAGKNCLIGALSECGIILGDDCIVSTGTCFTQNTPARWTNRFGKIEIQKAKYFSGMNGLIFRKNSLTGTLEVIPNNNQISINPVLHDNGAAKLVTP